MQRKRNLKILIYGINYHPELTGTGKYTGEMCDWLAERGHSVEVITGQPYYPQWQIYEQYKKRWYVKESLNGVTVHRSPLYVPKRVTGKARILHEISFNLTACIYWFSALFRKYDVIIAISPPLQSGIYPALHKLIKRVPFIFHIQDLQVDAAKNLGLITSKPLLYALELFEKCILRMASRVSTISEGMKEKILSKNIDPKNVMMIPNWANIDGIKPLPKELSLKGELGFSEEDRIILYSGNIGEKQGLEMVIDVAEKLQNHPNIHFVFAGAGASRERLKNLAESKKLTNLRFLPLQPMEKFSAMLAMADIHLVIQKRAASDLVMPSKLVNILSAGGLAIVTAEKGTALYNEIANNNMGITIEPENADALQKAIEDAIFNDPAQLKQNARKYAEDNLDRDKILMELERTIYELISRK